MMRIRTVILTTAFLLAACGQSIQARCSAAHGDDGGAYTTCVKQAESKVRNRIPRSPTPNG